MEIWKYLIVLSVIILLIIVGSKVVYNDAIVIVRGIQNVTVEENQPLDCTFNIDYPSGFSKDNCIVLAIGTRYSGNTKGFSFGTRDSYQSPGALVGASFGKAVTLLADKLVAHFYYAYGNANHNGASYSIEYEIVLMKIPTYAEGTDYKLGDVNGDGDINSEDFNLLNNYMQGNASLTLQQLKAADINKDGKIDAMDSYKLQQYIANGTPF